MKADDVLVTLRNTELDVAFEDVQGRLDSSRDQLRSVQQSIIFDKAVDFLVSKAKVTTVQPKA